ncbi:hypothetical protein LguiB_017882 [Lonicera macranthoides]
MRHLSMRLSIPTLVKKPHPSNIVIVSDIKFPTKKHAICRNKFLSCSSCKDS